MRGGVEVGDACSGNVESATLQCGNAFVRQLLAAVDQARLFCAVFIGFTRNLFVVGFVGLAQVGCVGIWHSAFSAHPQQGCAGVQAARKCDADFLAGGNVLKNGGHGSSFQMRCESTEVADVVVSLGDTNVETGIARDAELLACA
jgi:hypothetical protein